MPNEECRRIQELDGQNVGWGSASSCPNSRGLWTPIDVRFLACTLNTSLDAKPFFFSLRYHPIYRNCNVDPLSSLVRRMLDLQTKTAQV